MLLLKIFSRRARCGGAAVARGIRRPWFAPRVMAAIAATQSGTAARARTPGRSCRSLRRISPGSPPWPLLLASGWLYQKPAYHRCAQSPWSRTSRANRWCDTATPANNDDVLVSLAESRAAMNAKAPQSEKRLVGGGCLCAWSARSAECWGTSIGHRQYRVRGHFSFKRARKARTTRRTTHAGIGSDQRAEAAVGHHSVAAARRNTKPSTTNPTRNSTRRGRKGATKSARFLLQSRSRNSKNF